MGNIQIEQITREQSQFVFAQSEHISLDICERLLSEKKAVFYRVKDKNGASIAEIILYINEPEKNEREVFILAGAGGSSMNILERCIPLVEKFGRQFGASKASFVTSRIGLVRAMSKLVQADYKVSWDI